MSIDHKKIYNLPDISLDYGRRDYLYPAEKKFIEKFKGSLGKMDMLDMGVGGGRTTKYFAPLVKSYTAADYAPEMLKACRERYGDKYRFMECDVRNLQDYKADSFDFVLFSFNGIDSFSHRDRKTALTEIHRVLKKGGIFFFSSHNLDWKGLENIFSLKTPGQNNDQKAGDNMSRINKRLLSAIQKIKSLFKIIRLHILNRSINMKSYINNMRKKNRGHIYDCSLKGKASIYYIMPAEQLRQLKKAGFTNMEIYSCDGGIIKEPADSIDCGWLYYYCTKK